MNEGTEFEGGRLTISWYMPPERKPGVSATDSDPVTAAEGGGTLPAEDVAAVEAAAAGTAPAEAPDGALEASEALTGPTAAATLPAAE